MKIAMITNNYRPFVSGVAISVERQAKHLAKLGNEVTVFAPDFGENGTEESRENLRVVRFQSGSKESHGMVYPRLFTPEILKVFAEESFDCIHVHHPLFAGTTALHLRKKYGIPLIYTYHTKYEDYLHYLKFFEEIETAGCVRQRIADCIKNKLIPFYMKWFCSHCDMVFAPTPGMKEHLLEQGVNSSIHVLPTGLDEDFFKPDVEKTAEIRFRYAKDKKWLFCSIGRLEEEKNPEFLLEGLRILKRKEMLGSDFHFLSIGTGSMKEKLQRYLTEHDMEDLVTFIGCVPNEEIKHYLYASDLFLFASTSETQGIVLAEAMAAECPVVAVRGTGVEDIVRSGINGYMTEADPLCWAKKVMAAIEQEERLNDFRKRAKRTAENYRAEKLAKQQEKICYTDCMKLTTGEERHGYKSRFDCGRRQRNPRGDSDIFAEPGV